MIDKDGWVLCPNCNGKTRIKVDRETIIKNYVIFCPKCKKTEKIDIENLKMTKSH